MNEAAPGPGDLVVDGLVVRFGGLLAVDDVSLHVAVGQAVGLIGPNGAGKTTLFNACSGLVRPESGTISLFEQDITHKTPASRARLGLGRTFQRMELYERLSVGQNVAMGLEAKQAGGRLLGPIFSTRTEQQMVADAAEHALRRCGITHLAERRAGVLSGGQRRLVELARALAGDFQLLLLDEPSSGLDPAEMANFGKVLHSVVAQDGRGILLVEHNISMVRAVCGYTYVLDFGKLIDQGPTDQVLSSSVVRAAYLGEGQVA